MVFGDEVETKAEFPPTPSLHLQNTSGVLTGNGKRLKMGRNVSLGKVKCLSIVEKEKVIYHAQSFQEDMHLLYVTS